MFAPAPIFALLRRTAGLIQFVGLSTLAPANIPALRRRELVESNYSTASAFIYKCTISLLVSCSNYLLISTPTKLQGEVSLSSCNRINSSQAVAQALVEPGTQKTTVLFAKPPRARDCIVDVPIPRTEI